MLKRKEAAAATDKARKPRPLPNFETAPLFTYAEAAAFARGSLSTIRRRVADGTLKTVALGDNSPRILGDCLRRLLREGRT